MTPLFFHLQVQVLIVSGVTPSPKRRPITICPLRAMYVLVDAMHMREVQFQCGAITSTQRCAFFQLVTQRRLISPLAQRLRGIGAHSWQGVGVFEGECRQMVNVR